MENPARGQCAVTALIVQEHLGGELVRCECPGGSHYYNRLEDGTEIDVTREQFGDGFVPRDVESRPRAYVLSFPETRRRYEALRRRIDVLS
jgi:hypothetical protein